MYIEYDAENLQFYLWYKDYVKRFFQLPENQQALSHEWTPEQAQAERNALEKEKLPKKVHAEAAAAFKGTDFEAPAKLAPEGGYNPFNTPPRTPNGGDYDPSLAPSTNGTSNGTAGWSEHNSSLRTGNTDHTKKTANAFEQVDALQPCKLIILSRRSPHLHPQSLFSPSVRRSRASSPCTSPKMAAVC